MQNYLSCGKESFVIYFLIILFLPHAHNVSYHTILFFNIPHGILNPHNRVVNSSSIIKLPIKYCQCLFMHV